MRQQYLWIRQDFNPNEGVVLAIVMGLVLVFLNGDELRHFHNNVFQLGSSLITSVAMPLYKNARRISNPRRRPISRKIDEHTVPPPGFYIVSLTEKDDARFENLDIP